MPGVSHSRALVCPYGSRDEAATVKGGEARNGSKAERNTANMANIAGFNGTGGSRF